MSTLDPILAIGAADGRYRNRVESLAPLTSEFGLMRFRVEVECEWFLFLSQTPGIEEFPALSGEDEAFVRQIFTAFDASAAAAIKQFEAALLVFDD